MQYQINIISRPLCHLNLSTNKRKLTAVASPFIKSPACPARRMAASAAAARAALRSTGSATSGCPAPSKGLKAWRLEAQDHMDSHMGVSKNSGTPKWMVYNGKSLFKWLIWGYHYFRKHPYNLVHQKYKTAMSPFSSGLFLAC